VPKYPLHKIQILWKKGGFIDEDASEASVESNIHLITE
jgi:hypothetical protein